MTSIDRRPPEEWEAEDHIRNLKRGIPEPGSTVPGVCPYHSSLACATIWMIRRIDTWAPGGWVGALVGVAKASPVALLAVSIGFAAWVAARIYGVL